MAVSKRSCGQEASPSKALRRDWAYGIRLFVVPLGSATASRRMIWDREIKAAGGCLADSPWSATHMLLSPEVTPVRLGTWAEKLLEAKGRPAANDPVTSVRILSKSLQATWLCTDWLIACLAKQCRVLEEKFKCCLDASTETLDHEDRDCHFIADGPAVAKPQKTEGSSPALPASATASPARTEAESDDSDVEEVLPKLRVFGGEMTPKRANLLRNREKFACQRGGQDPPETSGLSPPKSRNEKLVSMFSRLQQHYESLGDGWRERSYRLTASILRGLPFEVTSEEDLDRSELRRLGKKTRDKLKEFLNTGSIGRVDGLHMDEHAKALGELQGIWGVGLTTARRWLGSGCRTVTDVRSQVQDGTLRLSADQLSLQMPSVQFCILVMHDATCHMFQFLMWFVGARAMAAVWSSTARHAWVSWHF